jgi:hypothetical protein
MERYLIFLDRGQGRQVWERSGVPDRFVSVAEAVEYACGMFHFPGLKELSVVPDDDPNGDPLWLWKDGVGQVIPPTPYSNRT